MDQRIRTRADAGHLPKGVTLDLLPLLAAYGRDRRVAMRIERMPSRARLSRGRNNGDGSWSVTRDELDGLSYIAPKNAKESPTLVVRIIGLESDNGATLAVLDYPVLDEEETERIESETAATDSAQREAEFRQLRAELTKTKAALRANQTELSSARQLWEAELEERLADATNDAAVTLDRNRTQWQVQAKERAAKLEARFAEQLAEAREALKRDDETERAKTEAAWKEAEAARFAAAEAKWREQIARALARESAERTRIEVSLSAARADAERNSADANELRSLRDEVETLRADLTDRDAKLAEAQSAAKKAHERARAVAERGSADGSELLGLRDEVETLRANLSDRDAKLAEAQSAAKEARERARMVTERGSADGSEIRTLRDEVETLRANFSDRDTELAEAQSAAKEALERARVVAERGSADGSELRNLRDEVETLRANFSDRDAKLAEAQSAAKEALGRARVVAERGSADGSELRRLRDEVETLRANLSDRDTKLAEVQSVANEAHKRARLVTERGAADGSEIRSLRDEVETLRARSFRSRSEAGRRPGRGERSARGRACCGARGGDPRGKGVEGGRDGADCPRGDQMAVAIRARARRDGEKVESAEKALADERKNKEARRPDGAELHELRNELAAAQAALKERDSKERRDTSETRRAKDALRQVQLTLEQRNSELAEAQTAAKEAAERASNDVEIALAKAEKEWEERETARFAEAKTHWQEQSSRVLKKARLKLEGAEAALAEARAQANSAHDLREGAELRRLRTEFAAARTKMTELETELAQAQVAAGRARERTREEVEAALAKAEETWKATEVVRISSIETQERERGGRALAEALSRLERTETALKEARRQTEVVREHGAVSLAEAVARYERTESQLKEARTRMRSMRDPANEAELGRLRQELGTIQIAASELEAEIGRARAETRKARDRASEQSKAAIVRAEEAWRVEEAHQLAAARREWERDARSAPGTDTPVDDPMEPVPLQRANRLLLDSMLAVCLAAAVVLIVTIWPDFYDVWPSAAPASGSGIPRTVTVVRPALSKPMKATAARAAINVAGANLRAEPSVTSRLVARLRRGDFVTPAERHGDWIHVYTDAAGGKPAQNGWIHYASLKMPDTH